MPSAARGLALSIGAACVWAIAVASSVSVHGGQPEQWHGVLEDHPAIQYATRPTTDRVARLNQALASGARTLARSGSTGYLTAVLEALGITRESQMLVFSKTGVQRAFTTPHTPRALYYNASVAVGYIPGAPALELAAHDPQQGVVFYTLDQSATRPSFVRATMCLTCHVSATTLNVPGIIARSNTVAEDGNVMPRMGSNDVDHRTPHPDRWGGWFVTTEALVQYAQRQHAGNITFSEAGTTSNQVFVDWISSAPEARGYLSESSDIVALLVFDHQSHAINLLTRLNWESRVVRASGTAGTSDGTLTPLVNELADYFVFTAEAPPSVPLVPRAGFSAWLATQAPRDRQGRSLAQLDLSERLMRYPCSYMIYSDAFDALPAPVKQAIYRRITDQLLRDTAPGEYNRAPAADRRATLDILRDTKPDFPQARDTDLHR